MGFPNKEEIESISEKLKNVEGTLLPPSNPTPIEQLRWDICQRFLSYKMERNITQKELAERLGIDEAKVSKILRHRIEEFSTDRLAKLLYQIDKKLTLKVMDVA